MRPEIFIAQRLNPSEADGMPAPVGVRIGVAGVALAFIVMLLSIAIVTGFKQEITRKVMGYESQLVIRGREDKATTDTYGHLMTVSRTGHLDSLIRSNLGPVNISSVTELPMLLKTDSSFQALILRSVDRSFDRSLVNDNLVSGEWQPNDSSAASSLAVSALTARELGLKTGDRVYAHFFREGSLSTRRLTISAVYDTHFEDYDSHFAFADMAVARSITKLPDSLSTSIAINGLPASTDFPSMAGRLESAIVFDALNRKSDTESIPTVTNVTQTGALYLNWLNLLDTNVMVIIILMSIVAGFTLVSSLFILILERVAMIGLLKAIGATNRQIRSIFIWLAEKIVVRGLVIGNIVGLAAYFIQHAFHIIPLDADAYYLSYVPMELSFTAVLILNLGVIAGSVLVLVVPSHIISKMSPVEALRRDNPTDE